MKLRTAALALGLATAGLTSATSTAAIAAPVIAAAPVTAAASHHACTKTSSGKCIKGGEFCKQSQYNHSGWDAAGRRYVCKGNRTHPHWQKP